jgi:hypothetical protein
MTPESHLVYHCLCGWHGPMPPPQALQCPTCGARLEAFTVMMDEPAPSGPKEWVLSETQRRQRWPTDFWIRVMRRVIEQELTIDPRLLAEAVLPYLLERPPQPDREMPQARRRRGRRSEPAYALDAEEFAARVILNVRLLEKDGIPVSQPRLARQLNLSLSTFKRYCTRYHLDYEELIRQARTR